MHKFRQHYSWLLPLVAILFFIPFSKTLDLQISSYFYDPLHKSFSNSLLFKRIYNLGVLPAFFLAFSALCCFLLSFFRDSLRPFRAAALSLFLVLSLGSGVLINSLLKEYWNRPRPKQIVEFGGEQNYQAFYQARFSPAPELSRSFPSGHSSMGFYFFSLALIARRHHCPKLFRFALFWSFFLGGLLSWTRIAQGGHFFSDTVLAAALIWWTSLTINYFVYRDYKKKEML